MSDTTTDNVNDAPSANPTRHKQVPWWESVLGFLSSFSIAVVVLVFLTLIVWLGTLAQIDTGLYEVQRQYFESFGLIHWFEAPNPFGKVDGAKVNIGVPLPGGYLLMLVLFVNMLCGLILKVRKDAKRIGMVIVHSSVLFLLLASWVSLRYKTEGNMALFEGEKSNLYESYTDWSIEVAKVGEEAGMGNVLIIPESAFRDLNGDSSRTFFSPAIPFDIEVSHYMRNAVPKRVGANSAGGFPAVDGITLVPQEVSTTAEENMSGLRLRVSGGEVSSGEDGILWGNGLRRVAQRPHTVTAGDGQYTVNMTRRTWVTPFAIRLEKFTRELHPNTGMARVFSSRVTKFQEGDEQEIAIEMNEPLRSDGYAVFQSSWGPQNAGPGDDLFSVFAIVNNPSDQWPLYFFLIIAVGLIVHFLIKLAPQVRRKKATPAPVSQPSRPDREPGAAARVVVAATEKP